MSIFLTAKDYLCKKFAKKVALKLYNIKENDQFFNSFLSGKFIYHINPVNTVQFCMKNIDMQTVMSSGKAKHSSQSSSSIP